jgi:hypothetical protein
VANDDAASMDAWTLILMLGSTALWTAIVVAVLHVTRAHRAARPLAAPADLGNGGSTSAHR